MPLSCFTWLDIGMPAILTAIFAGLCATYHYMRVLELIARADWRSRQLSVLSAELAEERAARLNTERDAMKSLESRGVALVMRKDLHDMLAQRAAHEAALRLIAGGCSKPAKVAASALAAERARTEDGKWATN